MRHASLAEVPCAVARTLDVVGEWWTLLIVRDALFGKRRFEEFKESGIADNILSVRLRRLVEMGVMERSLYQTRPDRHEYVLTEKGRALAPVVAALREWGRAWTTGEDRGPRIVHCECGHDVTTVLYCPHCARPVGAGDMGRVAAAV